MKRRKRRGTHHYRVIKKSNKFQTKKGRQVDDLNIYQQIEQL